MNLLRVRLREGGTKSIRPPADVTCCSPVGLSDRPDNTRRAKSPTPNERICARRDPLVQQLLLWFPEDTRLLWLLGELYNASGDIRAADQIMDKCVDSRRYESRVLREHRRIVKAGIAALPGPEPTPAVPAESFLPDTQTLWLVGGIGGIVVLLLVLLQLREWRRRGKQNRTLTRMPNRHVTNGITTDRALAARMAAARRHLVKAHPEFAPLIAEVGPCRLRPMPDAFTMLVDTVVSQQISVKAADSIVNRIVALTKKNPLTPKSILATDSKCIRACGLSQAKLRTIRELAERIVDRRLDLKRLHQLDDAAIAEMLPIPGIGP